MRGGVKGCPVKEVGPSQIAGEKTSLLALHQEGARADQRTGRNQS